MEMYIKDIWWKLRTWVSREQSFLIMLYLAFTVYLERTETERGREETEKQTDFGSRWGHTVPVLTGGKQKT